MVSVAKPSVLECWVVDSSCLIDEVECHFSGANGLLLGVYQILHAQNVSLVEVHDADVVETAENIVLYLTLGEGHSRVERVSPSQVQIMDDGSEVLVPVQMFPQNQRILGIHLNRRNILIQQIKRRICW